MSLIQYFGQDGEGWQICTLPVSFFVLLKYGKRYLPVPAITLSLSLIYLQAFSQK